MIVHEAEQGSVAWIEARLGIPTASQFSRIVTATGRLSKSRDGYLAELLAAWCLGEPVTDFLGTDATERGHALEPEARKYYSFQRDVDAQTVGLIYKDDSCMVGCSPDGLVGEDGLLELKCPMPPKHLLWLARCSATEKKPAVCPPEHNPQVQGQLWVSGRSWCDFMSYHPQLPPLLVRVEPDETYQAALDELMPKFVQEVIAGRERLRELGALIAPKEVAPVNGDFGGLGVSLADLEY